MGEDFPLDPNQVQPPEEVMQTEQVASQEVAPQQDESSNPDAADQEGASTDSADADIPDSYVRNKEKAEVMAHAENEAFDKGEAFPQNASLHAGIKYDMEVAESRVGDVVNLNKANKLRALHEVDRNNIHGRNQVLKYSDAIVEHYKQTGDKPSLALQALAEVHRLVQDTGYEEFGLDMNGDPNPSESVSVTFDEYENVIVKVGDGYEDGRETFTLSMFHGARYEVARYDAEDPGEDFDEVTVTKSRMLKPADVERIKEVMASAIKFKADDDRRYEEELQAEEDERNREQNPDTTFAHEVGWSETHS